MKRIFIATLVVVVLLSALCVGCAKQVPVTEPTTSAEELRAEAINREMAEVADAVTETHLFNLVNQVRIGKGLPELNHDSNLYGIALEYCKEMYDKGMITHDGFESRANLIRSNGYTLVGENLARGFASSQALLGAWLQSPTHEENIINPFFLYTGVACYKGYVCQIFGGYDLSPFIKPMFLSSLGIWQEHFEELK